ncbi:hypothetical protein [Variovorax sp. YR566]|uniref:hypothetical protein n=1 Tax=Variovorax sp. YR566 TaxID=3450237 RepID=UPI003F822DE0
MLKESRVGLTQKSDDPLARMPRRHEHSLLRATFGLPTAHLFATATSLFGRFFHLGRMILGGDLGKVIQGIVLDKWFARIPCWQSGGYDSEVIDIATGRLIYSNHEMLKVGQLLSKQLTPFFGAIGVAMK